MGLALRLLPGQRHRRRTVLGFDYDLDLADNAQRWLYRTGSYEQELTDLLVGELSQGDVYVDVGAHIGVHALVVARHLASLDGQVVAFEPTPDSMGRLKRAAARAGLPNVTFVQSGLGSEPGEIVLRSDPRFGRNDAGVRSVYGPGHRVGSFPVTTLDAWAEQTGLERLDVVKIDVEGSEYQVLLGMTDTLRRLRPRLVVVEMEDRLLERAGVSEEQIDALLAELGYSRSEHLWRNVAFRL